MQSTELKFFQVMLLKTKMVLLLFIFISCTSDRNEQYHNKKIGTPLSDEDINGLLVDSKLANNTKDKLSNSSLKTNTLVNFKRCSIDVVAYVSNNMKLMDDSLMLKFLYVFDTSCEENTELSSFSNEVLFKVINNYPLIFLTEVIKSDIKKELILKELQNPINDIVDPKKLYHKIAKLNSTSKVKDDVLRAISISINKLK